MKSHLHVWEVVKWFPFFPSLIWRITFQAQNLFNNFSSDASLAWTMKELQKRNYLRFYLYFFIRKLFTELGEIPAARKPLQFHCQVCMFCWRENLFTPISKKYFGCSFVEWFGGTFSGGICWSSMNENGRCTEMLSQQLSREQCCEQFPGVATAWSPDDLESGSLFFLRVLGGGVPCLACKGVMSFLLSILTGSSLALKLGHRIH